MLGDDQLLPFNETVPSWGRYEGTTHTVVCHTRAPFMHTCIYRYIVTHTHTHNTIHMQTPHPHTQHTPMIFITNTLTYNTQTHTHTHAHTHSHTHMHTHTHTHTCTHALLYIGQVQAHLGTRSNDIISVQHRNDLHGQQCIHGVEKILQTALMTQVTIGQ